MRPPSIPWLLLITLLSCLTACVSIPSSSPSKPYSACLCGPALGSDGVSRCAIWGGGGSIGVPPKIWESFPSPRCEASECSKFFSPFCQKIQMAGLPSTPPPTPKAASCYCDQVIRENARGETQLFCAAWTDESPNLIEYYSIENCHPQRCNDPPFILASKVCSGRFKAFYPPLLNKR